MTIIPSDLGPLVDEIVSDVGFTGVVRIDVDGDIAHERAYGLANRAYGITTTVDTQFGLASGAKTFTALVAMSMVERGELDLTTTARSVLGADLPLIDDRVTVEHLLTHRSGIGDYLDESLFDDSNAYVMPVPVHQLATTEDFLAVLGGHEQKFEPGERFEYCNGAFVVLALIVERCAGIAYHDLIDQRVCTPAGLTNTAFLRSDELPGSAAIGYLDDDGLRSNLLHLPVRGSGDGGNYSTAADIHRLWDALLAGKVVQPATFANMVAVHSDAPLDEARYGLGFWLAQTGQGRSMHGFDAGVGFVSTDEPDLGVRHSVFGNKTRGTWPVSERIGKMFAHP